MVQTQFTHVYKVLPGWGRGPQGHAFGVIPSVACDSQDRVYAVNRSPQPAVLVFDREGRFLFSWGEDVFTQPHAIWIGPDDRVFITDTRDHTVRVFTTEGRLLLTLGTKNRPSDTGYDGKSERSILRGGPPFNRPTRAVVGPSGCIYVSDGYGNTRIHKFSPDGTLLRSWGEPGAGPGQFSLPHTLWVDREERVLVADRENNRVQIFDGDGRFLTEWTDLMRPQDVYVDRRGLVHVAEVPQRISVFTADGTLIGRWGEKGDQPGQFTEFPHALWMDSRGDLYVAEVVSAGLFQKLSSAPLIA